MHACIMPPIKLVRQRLRYVPLARIDRPSFAMKIKSAEFESSAASIEQCLPDEVPEFAVIGRSNVGKSSLLNMLLNRRELVFVSKTPGHTKLINMFRVNKSWRLVDLPGYGYAWVSRKDRSQFSQEIADYISQRDNLRCVMVLIDGTLPPQQIDLEFVHWLMGIGMPFVTVFTKIDKVSSAKLKSNMEAFSEAMMGFSDNLPMMFTSSAKTKAGQQELHDLIRKVLAKPDDE